MYQKRRRKEKKRRSLSFSLSHLFVCSVSFDKDLFCQCLSFIHSYARLTTMASGPTANRPLTKTFCATCGKNFTARDAMQIYQENYYHPACFCCSNCGNSLAGKPFYPKPNNQFQCETCNHSLAPMYVEFN